MSRYRAPGEEDLPRTELPDVWEGPVPEERGYLPSHLADVYEGPDVETEPRQGEQRGDTRPPAETGAAMAEIVEAVRRSQEAGDEDDENENEGSGDQTPLVRIERDDRARRELSRPDVTLIHHVVVPGATIAMVGSLLFFLLDLRAAFMGGSFSLKWIGLCFVVATVLTARYSRLMGESDNASLYSSALAFVTFVAMAMSPWEPPQTEIWGPLLNGVVLYVTWRFASRLTGNLSADLDATTRRRRRLFGLERQALETWRRQQAADGKASYRLPRDLATAGRDARSDSESAQRAVARLTLLGLAIFALGEPILRLAQPELAGKALGAMVAFFISAGVLLGAASVAAQQRRLERLHASAPWTLVTGRLASALVLTVLVLALVLQVPAVHVEGSGRLQPATVSQGHAGDGDSDPARSRESQSGDEPSGENDVGKSSSERGEPADGPNSESDQGVSPPNVSGVLAPLAQLGSWLRWPILALVALLIFVTVVRWIGRQHSVVAALTKLLLGLLGKISALWSNLWTRLGRLGFLRFRRRKQGRGARRGADPFAQMAELRAREPGPAIVGAYAVLQAALADLGHVRGVDVTPLEYLRTIPGVLKRLRPAADRLTRLYLLAAYAPTRLADAQRRQAMEALEELRLASRLHADEVRR